MINPINARMLSFYGICEGMNVLGLSCGTREMSKLATVMVGNSGSFTGVEKVLPR